MYYISYHGNYMNKLQEIKKHLRAGCVYRREDMLNWSNAVDRHLKQLQEEGTLTKLSGGLYYCPKKTAFGNAPAKDKVLVKAFLKDERFLLASPNSYNALGVGTTQLYNETIVYNHKRHGHFILGGRMFDFRMKPYFPKTLTKEFLLVDLVNNLDRLAENHNNLLERVKEAITSYNWRALQRFVKDFATLRTKKIFSNISADRGSLRKSAGNYAKDF